MTHLISTIVDLLLKTWFVDFGLIDSFDAVVLESNENGIKVSEPRLIDTFINISIGALRGMLVKNFKQTPLEGCILPLIPMEAIRKMFTPRQ